jgi:prepilin-type processing-associated H-X9-DG protein
MTIIQWVSIRVPGGNSGAFNIRGGEMMNRSLSGVVAIAMAVVTVCCGTAWAQAQEVAGVVVDEAGNPISGARFVIITMDVRTIWQFTVSGETETDEDGRFSLSPDEQEFRRPYSFYVAQHGDYGLAWRFSIALGRTGDDISNLRLVLPEGGSVQGRVTDSEGSPVEGAVVTPFVTLPEGAGDEQESFLPPCEALLKATTGANGSFVLKGLPANVTVMLAVKHPDFAGILEGAPDDMRGMPTGKIAVGADDVTVQLQPGATIEGKVTLEETGAPVEGASVNARAMRTDMSALVTGPQEAATDAEGRYILRELAASSYAVTVQHPNGTAAPTTIKVAAGDRLTGQDIVLGKGVLISGKFVYAGTGEPVSDGQLVVIQKGAMGPWGQTMVELEADGTFSFRHPPGEIFLHGITGSYANAQLELSLVEGEDQTDVVLEVAQPLAFKGKVLGPDGEGVAGATVRSKWGGQPSPAKTQTDGSFELPLGGQQPREYEALLLDATHPDMPDYRGILMKPFQSESDAEGVIEMRRTGTIRGQVLTEDGNPIPSAKVRTTLRAEMRGWPDGNVTADGEGRYEWTDAASGVQYTVTATADGYGQDNSEQFSVDEDEKHEVRDLVLLVADQIIEGRVVNEEGNPVAGVNVNCNSRATGSRNTTTDEEGRFRLTNLVDEGIQIWAYHYSEAGSVQGQARAMAGDTEVEIVLGQQPQQVTAQEREAMRLVGERAFEIEVEEWVHGEATSLEELQGKIVVLALWDSTDDSVAEIVEALNSLSEERPDVAVIAVHAAECDREALQELVEKEDITFSIAIDKDSQRRVPGLTFETYRVKRPPAVFVIDPGSTVRYQDIPLGALQQAVDNVPKEVEDTLGPRKWEAPVVPLDNASCANNLIQMGIVFRMYANEHNGRFPQVDGREGNLMVEADELFPEYLTDLSVLVCPQEVGAERPTTADDVSDDSYFYLGWAIASEEEGLALLDAYESLEPAQRDTDLPLDPSKSSVGHEKIYRLREGIERFFITDINNPSASSDAQGRIPLMWERPGHHDPDGGNVLFMDGHVEYLEYPGKFPMTEAFIERCEEIAQRKYGD